ncbi:MAG: prepilin peptidase [Actinomycetota bacterium]
MATCAVAGAIALVAAVDDARTHLLRDRHTRRIAVVFAIGIAVDALWPERHGIAIASLVWGVAVFCGPWLVFHLIRPHDVGRGDVKYTAALGLGLGWVDAAAATGALVLVIVFGAIHALVVLVRTRSRREPVPLGPSIFAAWALTTVLRLTG